MSNLLKPVVKPKVEYSKLAPRFDTLKNKTICLVNNTRPEAPYVLAAAEKYLIGKKVGKLIHIDMRAGALLPDAILNEIIKADAAVMAAAS